MLKKFQLKNGLKVLLFESHKSPVVSVQTWVRTGSADEGKKEEGISHFIEHLLFKSTNKYKVGEIASLIEGSGGELNAYTSFDQTVFYITISKQFSELAVDALAEMMGFPQFDKTEIDPEREVVVEEIKRGQDSPGQQASRILFSSAYKKHPYRFPVIGYEKNVRSWSDKKLKQYYQSRYSPQNMFLVVTGDFESAEMKKIIEGRFGVIPKFPLKKIKRAKEPKQKQAVISVEQAVFEQSILYLAWKVPSVKHQDVPALDLLALVLGQGDSSRLVKRLRIDQATVNSIGSSVFSAQDEGLFVVSMGYNKKNLNLAMSEILEVLKTLLETGISEEELKKAITNIESEQFYSAETVDGLARQVGNSEFLMHRPDYLKRYISLIRKVTPQDLKKVAKKYLVPETLTVACLTNAEKKEAQKQLKSWYTGYKKGFKNWKIKNEKPKKLRLGKPWALTLGSKKSELNPIQLKNGTRILIRKNEDTHTICAKAAFLGGIRAEDKTKEGIVELLSRTWTGGTKNRTESEIYQLTESIASSVSPVCGRNSIGLSLDSLAPFEDLASDLFVDVLTNPIFPDDVLEREKLIQLEQIKARNDRPGQLCIMQFMKSLYKDHPYGKDSLGSEKNLGILSAHDIKKFWQSEAFRKNLTIIVSGNIKEDLWLRKLETGLAVFEAGQKFSKNIPVSDIREHEVHFTELKKEQSHLVYGVLGLTLHDQERYALHVMQSILAGMGGRLFLELREKNSLAYSVSPLALEGIDRGYFGAYIGCSPDKVPKALEMMKVEFDKLCQEKVSEEELGRAKRYLAGKHDIDLQRTSSIATSILYDDIYGLDPNETFNVAEKYFSVTSEDIMKVSQKLLSQKTVTSLVGPNNPLL